MNYKNFLKVLTESFGISGYESTVSNLIKENFQNISDDIKEDRFGNLICVKKGTGSKYKVMLAAHMDEIGLLVKDIDKNGFIKFTTVGGFDQRTLPSQEVIVHSKRDIIGVIGSKPPHLLSKSESDKSIKIDDMYIDVGLNQKEAKDIINIGDPVTVHRNFNELLNDCVSCKAIDDRAGIVVMAVCLEELKKLYHYHDVYAVATTQEELGMRGAATSAYNVKPDLAIAIDVTHGNAHGLNLDLELSKGPAIGKGPNIHPIIFDGLIESAKAYNMPYQVEPLPGNSGTDAWAIQISTSGVPTGLVSIPLRYMHTSVETISMKDVLYSGKLLAYYISNLPLELEEYLCY
ncbi:M42 family metallopeptidase [Thermoanaerobacterium sp. RBIITD]|uniref:M42 family metallopeptidase n=1 Tax=Thermoanaerobacterium sp. RBIITD TaxID=1550240 RepID=UPI000BB90886|nr:M42 family metallopeptidase [Thermoanaerobacterium sp. RBIITD]SNX55428.1 endoglucanase [Thermoanaerobacterium sp. RBIITD]